MQFPTYVATHTQKQSHIYTNDTYAHTQTHTHTLTHTNKHTHTFTYTNAHIQTHTHTHNASYWQIVSAITSIYGRWSQLVATLLLKYNHIV